MLSSVCPVLCPVVPVFNEFASIGFLLIQALAERHDPSFSIVIPVVVGSNPISHPILGRTSCCAFERDPAVKPHESSLSRCHERVRIIRVQIEYMHNRAANMLLPGQYDEAVANGDRLIVDSVSKTCIFTGEDLHR